MRKLITLLAFFVSVYAKAPNGAETSPGKVFFFSSVGLGVLDKGSNPSYKNSVQTSTGIGLKLSQQSRLGLALNFDSYGYKKTGTQYSLDGTLKATALALSYKYLFGTQHWRPFLKVGGGGMRLSVPAVVVTQSTAYVENKPQNLGVAMGEAGVQFRVHPRYDLFFGVEREWVGKSSLLNDVSLGVTTFRIGLVSSL